MSPERRAAERQDFGSATPGEAQSEEPAPREEMLDRHEAGGASPERVVAELRTAVFGDGDLAAIERLVAPDHANHDPAVVRAPAGPQGVRQAAAEYREAFPDLRVSVEEIFSSGSWVAHRWTLRGTHEGELAGFPPTREPVEITGLGIDRVLDGKVAESWSLLDLGGLRAEAPAD